MIGFEDSIILINYVEHDYLRKKFGVVYIRRHTVLSPPLSIQRNSIFWYQNILKTILDELTKYFRKPHWCIVVYL